MHARTRRVTALLGLCVVMAVGSTACGDASDPVETGAGTEPVATTEPPGTEPASPVDGLTAAELRSVVEAPPGPAPTGRARTGPVADRVPVGGRTVLRITIPGSHTVLSSRIAVAVGGRDVGEGVVTPDLSALVAVVTDPTAVVAGAAVTYRWGAGDPIAAGPLEVVR